MQNALTQWISTWLHIKTTWGAFKKFPILRPYPRSIFQNLWGTKSGKSILRTPLQWLWSETVWELLPQVVWVLLFPLDTWVRNDIYVVRVGLFGKKVSEEWEKEAVEIYTWSQFWKKEERSHARWGRIRKWSSSFLTLISYLFPRLVVWFKGTVNRDQLLKISNMQKVFNIFFCRNSWTT